MKPNEIKRDPETGILLHQPENTKPLTTIYACLSRDADGNEGLCGAVGPLGAQVCVTGDLATARRMYEVARPMCRKMGVHAVLRSYAKANDLEVDGEGNTDRH